MTALTCRLMKKDQRQVALLVRTPPSSGLHNKRSLNIDAQTGSRMLARRHMLLVSTARTVSARRTSYIRVKTCTDQYQPTPSIDLILCGHD